MGLWKDIRRDMKTVSRCHSISSYSYQYSSYCPQLFFGVGFSKKVEHTGGIPYIKATKFILFEHINNKSDKPFAFKDLKLITHTA